MYRLPFVLFAAIDTRIWLIEQVRFWADSWIQAATAPAVWVMDLSLVLTLDEAEAAIRRTFGERSVLLPDDIANLMIGMLYIRFQQGDLGREQFVSEVADVIDAYEPSILDVERWTKEMAGSATSASLEQILSGLARDSAVALGQLTDVGCLNADPFFSEA